MPTPREGYFCKNGDKVPSVTQVVGRFKESGGLIHWAWQLGKEGKNYRDEQQSAASIGTMVHDMVEHFIKNLEWIPPLGVTEEDLKKVERGFNAYKTWQEQSRIEVVETEMRLVSEMYRFGGTPDALGKMDGKFTLLDWKASNSVYSDYLCQLSAYRHLLQEVRDIQIEGYHLCRFSKDFGDFSHHYYEDLSEAWEAFLLMRRLYDLDKSLKKRVK